MKKYLGAPAATDDIEVFFLKDCLSKYRWLKFALYC